MKLKTRKAITKRFKITKSGKVLRRPTGLDHCRSKKRSKTVRQSRKWVEMPQCEARKIKKILKG